MTTAAAPTQQMKLSRILLVEDNPVDARLVGGLLRAFPECAQFEHLSFLNDAVARCKTDSFDVVLLDLNLDDSSGYETFARMRASAPQSAILVLSGSDDEALAIRTVREGAQDYLVKGSFDAKLLLRAIRYARERKAAEEALRKSEATVRAIFENSLDGIVIFSDKGGLLEANSAAAALVCSSREELIGRRLYDFFLDKHQGEESIDRSTAGSGRGQLWIQRCDGIKRLVDYCFKTNILPGQHLGVLRDITEQQNLEEQLRQSQKLEAIGRLAGGVAHDFNNILGVISGYAELMEMQAPDERVRSKSSKILLAVEKATNLTKQLLAFGRRQVLLPRNLNLGCVIHGISNMLTVLMGPETQVVIQVSEPIGIVHADQGQIEQIILNLAANANDAMPDGGTLTMGVDNYDNHGTLADVPPGKYVRLSVHDTGCGMERELQSRIFEPFFTTKETGSGLGLATVYGIIKQAAGFITVQSAPQQGATFTLYLPRVEEGRLEPLVPSEETPEAGLQGVETVLVVDDEPEIRNSVKEYLQELGYNVLLASDGGTAIKLADGFKGRISLLITDMVMPGLNGGGLVEHIRATRPEVKILLISGFAGDSLDAHGFLDPASFLQKPFTLHGLGMKIRTLLDSSSRGV